MDATPDAAVRLMERLLSDADFRSDFRRDPVAAARAAGLGRVDDALLEQLRALGPDGLQNLEVRESRSSLAGVLMAAAVEGVSLHDLGENMAQFLDHPAAAPAPRAQLASYELPTPAARPVPAAVEVPQPDPRPVPVAHAARAPAADQVQEMRAVPAEESGGGGSGAVDALDLLQNHNIVLDADGARDLRSGQVDPRLVSILDRISHGHKIAVSVIKTGHSRNTAGGSVSNHFYGRALDLSVVDGQPVGPGNSAARRIAAGLMQLPRSIRPTEIGSPWKLPGPAYFSDAAHQNHLHIGFDDPAPDGWKPPASSGGIDSGDAAGKVPGDLVEPDDSEGDDSEGDDGAEREDGGSGDTEAEADEESDGSAGGGDDEDDEDEDEDDDSEAGDHDDDSGDSSDDGGSGGESDSDSGDGGDSSDGGADNGFVDPGIEVDGYPGDSAPREQIAAWMATEARKRGLPSELPIMASLVESGLKNLPGGDADSVGYFQMRVSIWNHGAYAGYAKQPAKQLDWFLDNALAVKKQRAAAGRPLDSSHYGDWIADVERPAAQYRGRYQPMLAQARALLEHARAGRSAQRQSLPAIDPG